MTDVFELSPEHEQVVFCNDPATGLRAIIALHNTALGPGLGGTRFYPYASTDAAVRDVLALSRGMTYKNSLAGLDLGGGKAVIIGDPATMKSEALLRAYGRFVQSLHGRYLTACDVGTFSEDMDHVARECDFVTGRTVANGGAGDSSVLTAYGVFQGMRAAAEAVWGEPTLAGRTVGIAGVGKVGRHLVRHLTEDGASVVVTDVNEAAVDRIRDEYAGVRAVASTDALVAEPLDVYSPNALGGALTDEVVEALSATIVCGGANNQLAHPGVEKRLEERGILYAPDYCVNSGGVIQVADELHGFSFERAEQRAAGIFETTRRVFETAKSDGVPPAIAADRLAERRIRDVGRTARDLPGLTTYCCRHGVVAGGAVSEREDDAWRPRSSRRTTGALDAYEHAKRAVPRLAAADEVSAVVDTLSTGRYLRPLRPADSPRPELRVPCFFNPQHGPSVRDVRYTVPGGHGTRTVPACARTPPASRRARSPRSARYASARPTRRTGRRAMPSCPTARTGSPPACSRSRATAGRAASAASESRQSRRGPA